MSTAEHFLEVADLLRDALLLLTAEGTVLAANRAAAGLLACDPRGLRGQPLTNAVTDPAALAPYLRACSRSRDPLLRALTITAATGEQILCRCEGNLFRPRSEGEQALVLLRLLRRDETDGRCRALNQQIDALSQEIAHRKRLETELRQRADELLTRERQRDAFLGMLAHELRAPLAPFLTSIHVARDPSMDSRVREQALEVMARQARQLARLIDTLMDVSRLDRGLVRLHLQRLDLSRLVRTAVEDRRPLLERAGLTLVVATPETPVWALGDAVRLVQVVSNLLDHATRSCDRGGKVTVRVASAEGQAVLTVRHTGVGIEPDMLPRVFDLFAQAEGTLAHTRGGLGLNLAVVKGLVALHGGTVSAASDGPGHGAEFTMRLRAEAEPAALVEAPLPAEPTEQRLRVVVIEDNRDAADSLRLLLQMLGHEVRVAYSGNEGLQLATTWPPDAVLSDVGLPGGLDGYGLAAALRRQPATARALLVAITGYGSKEDLRRSRQAGFDHHLVKPADPEVIQRLLATRRDPG